MMVVLLGMLSFSGWTAIDTASTGNWNSSGTWSSGTSPASGDTLVIPAGVTVTVNCNCGTYSNMHIIVYGTLTFPGGRKINMSSNGQVDVYTGGTISGSNGGDKITIGGTSVWRGDDPDVTGPSSCGSSGCASNPTLPVELVYARFNCTGKEVECKWETASEINNDYFRIMFSRDAEWWEEAGVITGAGNSKTSVIYETTLTLPSPSEMVYIKLEQVDFDGTVTVEDMAQLTCGGENKGNDFSMVRTGQKIQLQFGDDYKTERVSIFSIDGRCQFNAAVTDNVLEWMPTESGVYLIRCKTESGKVLTKKMIF